MARTPEEVMQTILGNFISHNAQLVSQNEMLLEQNTKLTRQLDELSTPKPRSSYSDGQLFDIKTIGRDLSKEESTGTD